MNTATANSLLKNLEEPPAGVSDFPVAASYRRTRAKSESSFDR